MKSVLLSCAILLTAVSQAQAQTTTPTVCTGGELLINIATGILTVPMAATNLGMGLGATFGSSRGIGIGATVTGGLGIGSSFAGAYLTYAVSLLHCSVTASAVMTGVAFAMGGFALGMGIYRIIMSSKPKVAVEPVMYPFYDERKRAVTGMVAGLSVNWEMLTSK